VALLIYLGAMVIAFRLPEQIDVPIVAPVPAPATPPDGSRATPPDGSPRATLPLDAGEKPENGRVRGRWRTLANVGPVVAEAMTVNAVLRAFSGYILFLLAFLLRSLEFGPPGHPV